VLRGFDWHRPTRVVGVLTLRWGVTLDDDAFASSPEEFLGFGLRCLFDGLQALVDRRRRQDGGPLVFGAAR